MYINKQTGQRTTILFKSNNSIVLKDHQNNQEIPIDIIEFKQLWTKSNQDLYQITFFKAEFSSNLWAYKFSQNQLIKSILNKTQLNALIKSLNLLVNDKFKYEIENLTLKFYTKKDR